MRHLPALFSSIESDTRGCGLPCVGADKPLGTFTMYEGCRREGRLNGKWACTRSDWAERGSRVGNLDQGALGVWRIGPIEAAAKPFCESTGLLCSEVDVRADDCCMGRQCDVRKVGREGILYRVKYRQPYPPVMVYMVWLCACFLSELCREKTTFADEMFGLPFAGCGQVRSDIQHGPRWEAEYIVGNRQGPPAVRDSRIGASPEHLRAVGLRRWVGFCAVLQVCLQRVSQNASSIDQAATQSFALFSRILCMSRMAR